MPDCTCPVCRNPYVGGDDYRTQRNIALRIDATLSALTDLSADERRAVADAILEVINEET